MKYIVIKKTIREEVRTFEAENENEAYAQVMETDHKDMQILSDDTWVDGIDWFASESVTGHTKEGSEDYNEFT